MMVKNKDMKNNKNKDIKNNDKQIKSDVKDDKKSDGKGYIEKNNIWKITAIIFIVLFAVILISALVRLSRIRPPIIQPTDSQISMMKSIALSDLSQKGEDVTNYTVKASNDIRPVNAGSERRKMEGIIEEELKFSNISGIKEKAGDLTTELMKLAKNRETDLR